MTFDVPDLILVILIVFALAIGWALCFDPNKPNRPRKRSK